MRQHEITRKRLRDTEYELSSTRTDLERRIITMEHEAKQAEMLRTKLSERVSSLESDRRFLYEQKKNLQQKVQAMEKESLDYKSTTTDVISNLREENFRIKEELSQLRGQSRATESELSHKVRTLSASLLHHQETLSQTQGDSASQSSLAEQKHKQLTTAHGLITDLEDQIRQLRQNVQGQDDVVRVQRELKTQVAYIKQLEATSRQLTAECRHYKDLYRNAEVLKEEKVGLEQKLKMQDELRTKCAKLDVENEILRKEKEQWAVFLESKDSTGFGTPNELVKTLAMLRASTASLSSEKDGLCKIMKEQSSQVQLLEKNVEDLQQAIIEKDDSCKKQAARARQQERVKDLALRQVESLKEQLKSYDTEEARLMGGSYDNQKNLRIEHLEAQVEELLGKLENATSAARHPSEDGTSDGLELLKAIQEQRSFGFNQMQEEKQALLQAKLELEEGLDYLRKENASLEAAVNKYQIAIEAGPLNPLTQKTQELSEVATAQRVRQQNMMEELEKENEELIKLVAELRPTSSAGPPNPNVDADGDTEVPLHDEGLIPKASYNRIKDHRDRLVQEIRDRTKREMRLQKSWALKAEEYRTVVDSLLGYKMHFLDNGQVELVSVFEPEQDQAFAFDLKRINHGTIQWRSESGNLQRKHGETFDRSVQEYGNCIPAFLSQVTLNLIKEQHEEATMRGESLAHKGPARVGQVSDDSQQRLHSLVYSEESEPQSRGHGVDESESEREDLGMAVDP
ncbi:coiled-coil domain-containing protein mad1 [Gryganskiella cystojenkinii]|nr:coiled-coil domain-containing protein mad1 [Gryganskiella cystojenkinii]